MNLTLTAGWKPTPLRLVRPLKWRALCDTLLPCLLRTIQPQFPGELHMSMYIGEALVGEGNEIAHIDLLIGDKSGPVGNAFANALARQSHGHSNLLAVLTPNVAVKPATV